MLEYSNLHVNVHGSNVQYKLRLSKNQNDKTNCKGTSCKLRQAGSKFSKRLRAKQEVIRIYVHESKH